jgi:hypothetical protein
MISITYQLSNQHTSQIARAVCGQENPVVCENASSVLSPGAQGRLGSLHDDVWYLPPRTVGRSDKIYVIDISGDSKDSERPSQYPEDSTGVANSSDWAVCGVAAFTALQMNKEALV